MEKKGDYKVKDSHFPGGIRDVPKLDASTQKSALCERRARSKSKERSVSKERSLGASQSGPRCSLETVDSTTSTTDSGPHQRVGSKTSHVSDVSSSKAEEPHAEPELTRVDIEVKPQNDIRNSGDDEHEVIPSHHEAGTKPSRRHSV
eukprot:gnl/TRDRNA2_/TRDRNA2_155957_c1_seq3.p1 gnl/TRDRNA2_/TRDRNA2_155957_c1~~gnl/TRDRNA2_/TRDRNA2_155957_c1_seq3.p1  ORF type:complete len:147 (-),score=20.03 gnl/TRDRNA2_/TRDRNA2_155957_c1_seq3:38-478(-)